MSLPFDVHEMIKNNQFKLQKWNLPAICPHLDRKRALVHFLFILVWWIPNQRWRSCVVWPESCCCVCCHRKTPSRTRCAAASPRSSPPKVLFIHPSMEGGGGGKTCLTLTASHEAPVAQHLTPDVIHLCLNLTSRTEGREMYFI